MGNARLPAVQGNTAKVIKCFVFMTALAVIQVLWFLSVSGGHRHQYCSVTLPPVAVTRHVHLAAAASVAQSCLSPLAALADQSMKRLKPLLSML